MAKGELKVAWERLSLILEGDLFAEGPNQRTRPIIEELQKSCLGLAFDLAQRVDPAALQSLALEMVEWFPREPTYWLHLAAVVKGDLRELLVKRLALKRALSLSPWNKRAALCLDSAEAALGLPHRIRPLVQPPFGPLETKTVVGHQVRLECGAPTSRLVSLLCDLAERALEGAEAPPKRGKLAQDHHQLVVPYHAKLATPIETLLEPSHPSPASGMLEGETQQSTLRSATAPGGEEDSALQLSQPASLRNLQEFSQPSSSLRSQSSRRLRASARDAHLSEQAAAATDGGSVSRLTTGEIASRLGEIFARHPLDTSTRDVLQEALRTDQGHAMAIKGFILDQGPPFDPPIENLSGPHTLQQWLLRLAQQIVEQGEGARWSEALASAMDRLGTILATNIETLGRLGSTSVLLWLAEQLVVKDSPDPPAEAIASLLPRLRLRILRRGTSLRQLMRYLWVEYKLDGRVEYLERLEMLFAEEERMSRVTPILILGAMDSGACPILNGPSLTEARRQFERAKLVAETQQQLAILEGPARWDWLIRHVGDVSEWLGQIYNERSFIELALSIAAASSPADRAHANTALALALAKSIACRADVIDQVLLALAPGRSDYLIALFKEHPMVARSLLAHLEARGNLLPLLLSLLPAFKLLLRDGAALGACYTLIYGLWRNFLVPSTDAAYLADPRFVTELSAFLLLQPGEGVEISPTEHDTLLILRYCLFRTIAESPYLDIPSDAGLVKSLGEARLKSTRGLQAEEAVSFFNAATKLVDLQAVDGTKALALLETITGALAVGMEQHPTIKQRAGAMRRLLQRPIDQSGSPDTLLCKLDPEALGFADTCGEALSLKAAIAKNLNLNKKKSAESLQAQRADMINRLLVVDADDREEVCELLWQLGALFDAELCLCFARDAAAILEASATIYRLFLGNFNCWKLSLLLEAGTDRGTDLQRLGKFTCMIQSMFYRVLSFFLPPDQLQSARARRSIARTLLALAQGSDRQRDRRALQAKALAAQLCQRAALEVAALRVSTVTAYLSGDAHVTAEVLYVLISAALEDLFRAVKDADGGETPIGSLVATLIAALATNCSWFDETLLGEADEPRNRLPLREQLLAVGEQLIKLDKKKIHHQHLHLLIQRYPTEDVDELARNWSRLIPALAKSKSAQLVNLWQSEQDYPGDYLYFAEVYIEEAAQMLAAAATTERQILRAAEMIALLIGRVSVASNIFVRRRRVLGRLHELLCRLVASASSISPSLADFKDDDEFQGTLADILEDAEQLVSSQGLLLPPQ